MFLFFLCFFMTNWMFSCALPVATCDFYSKRKRFCGHTPPRLNLIAWHRFNGAGTAGPKDSSSATANGASPAPASVLPGSSSASGDKAASAGGTGGGGLGGAADTAHVVPTGSVAAAKARALAGRLAAAAKITEAAATRHGGMHQNQVGAHVSVQGTTAGFRWLFDRGSVRQRNSTTSRYREHGTESSSWGVAHREDRDVLTLASTMRFELTRAEPDGFAGHLAHRADREVLTLASTIRFELTRA